MSLVSFAIVDEATGIVRQTGTCTSTEAAMLQCAAGEIAIALLDFDGTPLDDGVFQFDLSGPAPEIVPIDPGYVGDVPLFEMEELAP